MALGDNRKLHKLYAYENTAKTPSSSWIRTDYFDRLLVMVAPQGASLPIDVFIDQSVQHENTAQASITAYYTSVYSSTAASGLAASVENLGMFARVRYSATNATALIKTALFGRVDS